MAATINMLLRFSKNNSFKLCRFTLSKTNNFRCSSTLVTQSQSEFSIEPQYPPVMPRWPPGKWGDMKDKHAWQFYEEAVKIQDTNILHEKLETLTDHEDKRYFIVETDNVSPRILDFQKYITKTAVVDGLPPMFENICVEKEFTFLKPIIIDGLVREYHAQYKHASDGKAPHLQSMHHCRGFLHTVVDMLVAALSGTHEHLLRSQIDEEARVECFWRKLMDKGDNEDFWAGLDKHNHMRYQLKHVADFMVRTEQPLPEFLPREDSLCTEAEVPVYKCHPLTASVHHQKEKPSVVAGYKTKNQFWDGSPCEFGLVSFHTVNKMAYKRECLNQNIDREFVTGLGILSSFGWTVAQAYNQGFDWMNDVTYPFTTQTVVTDGRNISFFAYQLNTMMLWKNNDANPLRNICWAVPETKLFEFVEGDVVVGFNDDALKTLIKMFKNKPADRGVDLRPYLTKDYEPLKAVPYMNMKGDPVIERPHPPRLYGKSKKKKVISPIVETEAKIKKAFERGNRHWNEETQRFDIVERK